MDELVVLGFAERLRAVEVLPQLQRLNFDWSVDLRTAVAVEVENDGKLRLHHGQLLDPAYGPDDSLQWKAILNAIVPLPHPPVESTGTAVLQARIINAKASDWLKRISRDRDFVRNVAAVLRPRNSAILAILRDSQVALPVLSSHTSVVLHTTL